VPVSTVIRVKITDFDAIQGLNEKLGNSGDLSGANCEIGTRDSDTNL
jgi:hypothetical protein